MKTTEGERVTGILDLLKEVSQDKRIKDRVHLKVLIGHRGGMNPEMTVVFHGPYFQEKFEVEMLFFAGADDYECVLSIFYANINDLDARETENVYLRQMSDVKSYFEKIMKLYE